MFIKWFDKIHKTCLDVERLVNKIQYGKIEYKKQPREWASYNLYSNDEKSAKCYFRIN